MGSLILYFKNSGFGISNFFSGNVRYAADPIAIADADAPKACITPCLSPNSVRKSLKAEFSKSRKLELKFMKKKNKYKLIHL